MFIEFACSEFQYNQMQLSIQPDGSDCSKSAHRDIQTNVQNELKVIIDNRGGVMERKDVTVINKQSVKLCRCSYEYEKNK